MAKAKLPKNIFQNGGKYLVRKQYDGQRISITFDTLSEAVQKVNEMNELKKKRTTLTGDDTVDRFFNEYVIPEREKFFKESTIEQNIDLYKAHVEKRIGKKNLIAVTEYDIKHIITDLEKKGRAENTIKAVKRIMNILFTMAKERKLVEVNPVTGIVLKRDVNTATKNRTCKGNNKAIKQEDVLSLREVGEFLEMAKDSFYYNVYLFALKTGMRYGEICGLEQKDIHYDENRIDVQGTLIYSRKNKCHCIRATKTESSERRLFMSKGIAVILKQQELMKKENREKYGTIWSPKNKALMNLVFYSKNGNIISRDALTKDLNEIERKLIEKYGKSKHLHMHLFRHTFATLGLEEKKISIRTMQGILGHASPEITMKVYWKLLMEKADGAMNDMDELF